MVRRKLHRLVLGAIVGLLGLGASIPERNVPKLPPDQHLPASPIVVFERKLRLPRGEHMAAFLMSLVSLPSSPDASRRPLSEDGALQIEIRAGGGHVILVPPQVLRREDFPSNGSGQTYRAFFFLEEEGEVHIRVAQAGDLNVEVQDFSVSQLKEAPTRVLLLAGRGADVTAWGNYASQGSDNYGLVDGGRHFLAFIPQTSPCGSLAERTLLLAEYINSLHLPDQSLKAIGHSMGGLDLRYLVGLGHDGIEPYASAARKLQKVYTMGTPHHGVWLANLGRYPPATWLFRDFLCIGQPILDDIVPAALRQFNRRYPRDEFSIDGRRIPFLAFTFEARCLPWWIDPLGIIRHKSDAVVSLTSQAWGPSDNPPRDLPWSAVHAPPLDVGPCISERASMDVLNWVLADPVQSEGGGL